MNSKKKKNGPTHKNPKGNFLSKPNLKKIAILCASPKSIAIQRWEGMVPPEIEEFNVTYVVSPKDYDVMIHEYSNIRLIRGLEGETNVKFDYILNEYCPVPFVRKQFIDFITNNLADDGSLFTMTLQNELFRLVDSYNVIQTDEDDQEYITIFYEYKR